jgi:TonB family protein
LSSLLTVFSYAQNQRGGAESQIKSGLEGKILILKTAYREDKLHFDALYNLIGNAEVGPWTTHGWIKISRADLDNNQLVLQGKRVILVMGSVSDKPSLVPLLSDEKIQISCDLADPRQWEESISRLFEAQSVQERMDNYWVPRANLAESLDVLSKELPDGIVGTLEGNRPVYVLRKKASIKPPKAIATLDPGHPDSATKEHISGVNVVRVIVNEQGLPELLQLVQSLKGLDEATLIAVSKWRFHPATKDGNAVAVVVNVQTNFQ